MRLTDRSRLGLAHASPAARVLVLVAVLGCVAITAAAALHGGAATASSSGLAGNLTETWTAPQRPAALFVGDSYTAGTGADSPSSGYPCLTADAMGWVCLLDAEGGTGYVNNGHLLSKSNQPLAGRLAQDKQLYTPDVVVVDAGRNDGSYPITDAVAAAKTYLRRLHAAFPQARLVLVAPAYVFSTSANDPYGVQFAAALHELGRPYHAVVIDPLAEKWEAGRDWHDLVEKDHIHPNQVGHDLIARRLTADLKAAGLGRLKAPDRSL